MTRALNLADIQGNVTRAYGRFSFPFARYFFLNISNGAEGRAFINKVRRQVTTAARWSSDGTSGVQKPQCTMNVGFTFLGMLKLEIPSRTMQGMPFEFIEGMKDRAFMLGDRDQTQVSEDAARWDAHWDPIWQNNRAGDGNDSNNVHIWISLNAQLKKVGTTDPVDALEEKTELLRRWCDESNGGVRILKGNSRDGTAEYQSASAVFEDIDGVKMPTPKEHFGFTDGIGDPVFKGQYPDEKMKTAVIGRGKLMDKGGEPLEDRWAPLETGEFILGHPDEAQELPPAARPFEFSQNGTFMAYRKLHENVGTFKEVLEEEAKSYAAHLDVDLEEARETLMAKMCGRWSDGVPLSKISTYAEWQAFGAKKGFHVDKNADNPVVEAARAAKAQLEYIRSPDASNFRYADDMAGLKCPVGAHMRRVNTRDYLDPMNEAGVDPQTGAQPENENATTALNRRRRILRRGLPYGPPNFDSTSDDTEQGVAMMLMGASLFRQFEFVQQQWIQYGLDFHEGNNTCPMLGNHEHHKRHTIASDPATGKPPYVMSKLKTFVECRGGDYFFIPSMTALRMIAMGIVDPT